MVSISRAAPAASRIWSVAFMISGPMPSPCATVMGVLVGIFGTSSIVGLLDTPQQDPVVFFYTGTIGPPGTLPRRGTPSFKTELTTSPVDTRARAWRYA